MLAVWQADQQNAADWDEDWEEFIDEGFSITRQPPTNGVDPAGDLMGDDPPIPLGPVLSHSPLPTKQGSARLSRSLAADDAAELEDSMELGDRQSSKREWEEDGEGGAQGDKEGREGEEEEEGVYLVDGEETFWKGGADTKKPRAPLHEPSSSVYAPPRSSFDSHLQGDDSVPSSGEMGDQVGKHEPS